MNSSKTDDNDQRARRSAWVSVIFIFPVLAAVFLYLLAVVHGLGGGTFGGYGSGAEPATAWWVPLVQFGLLLLFLYILVIAWRQAYKSYIKKNQK
jgi:H+/Cl- antiporter ClcA